MNMRGRESKERGTTDLRGKKQGVDLGKGTPYQGNRLGEGKRELRKRSSTAVIVRFTAWNDREAVG